MLSEQLAPTPNIPSTNEFHIDDGIGKDTTVSVMSRSLSNLDVLLSGPSNFLQTESGVSVESLTLSVQEEVIQVIYTEHSRKHFTYCLFVFCISIM